MVGFDSVTAATMQTARQLLFHGSGKAYLFDSAIINSEEVCSQIHLTQSKIKRSIVHDAHYFVPSGPSLYLYIHIRMQMTNTDLACSHS